MDQDQYNPISHWDSLTDSEKNSPFLFRVFGDQQGIPFIDVGMGLHRKRGSISGQLRTTYFPKEHAQVLRDKGLAPLKEGQDDIYKTNIQIGELNALNACFAVIRFKQLRGFYFEENPYHQLILEVGDFQMVKESEIDEN